MNPAALRAAPQGEAIFFVPSPMILTLRSAASQRVSKHAQRLFGQTRPGYSLNRSTLMMVTVVEPLFSAQWSTSVVSVMTSPAL